MKRIILLFIVLFFLPLSFYSQVINDTQVIKTGDPVYDSLNKLCKEQGILVFNENSMLTVMELKFYLDQIKYDSLSDAGKFEYENIENFLYTKSNIVQKLNDLTKLELMDTSVFSLDLNLILNPELYYKSNSDIPWSFNYFYQDNLGTVPVKFGISDYITIESDPFLGKSHYGASEADSYCNIPILNGDPEFMFMRYAYGSTGICFDKWGFNFILAKEGLKIGNTSMASIIYNNSFETDGYAQLNIFTNSFKYSMDIIQVDFQKYLYLHQLEFILLKKLKFSLVEGSLACDSLQLRFLNPFMFMHQFSAWNDYSPDNSPYSEQNFCAYFSWLLECTLIKNTRLYVLYSQNEIQSKIERETEMGALYPDSLGLQIGADISIPYKNNSYWNISLEGVYTSPYLYLKFTPKASLYRVRDDNLSSDYIKSWIGSPYGPDSIGLQFMFGYEKVSKWKLNLGYLFTAKGENDFGMFEEYAESKNEKYDGIYSSYYPTVAYKLGLVSHEEAYDDAMNMLPSGIIQFTNQIVLNGEYRFNKHIKTNGQFVYSLINNLHHEENKFGQGIEIAVSMTYNLF